MSTLQEPQMIREVKSSHNVFFLHTSNMLGLYWWNPLRWWELPYLDILDPSDAMLVGRIPLVSDCRGFASSLNGAFDTVSGDHGTVSLWKLIYDADRMNSFKPLTIRRLHFVHRGTGLVVLGSNFNHLSNLAIDSPSSMAIPGVSKSVKLAGSPW